MYALPSCVYTMISITHTQHSKWENFVLVKHVSVGTHQKSHVQFVQ